VKTRQIIVLLLCIASPAIAQVSPWASGTYAYDGSGNVKRIGADYYTYDQVGRLVRGTADKERSGLESYQAYTYDAFGNRLTTSTTGTFCVNGCGVNVQVNNNGANNNRVTDHGASYDAAGNLKHFDTNYYTYDAAGMLVTRSSSQTSADAEYIYTADDERLAVYTGGGNWRFTIRDLDAKVLREVTAFQSGATTTWTWHRDHIFRDGLLLATVLPEGVQHYHLDHLGTPHLVTDGTGRKIGVHVYYPFGDELALALGEQTSPERLKYTGHERDDASNGTSLDDMHARYYSSLQGRFLSVDPVIDFNHAMSRPQVWNRYAYVSDNPLRYTDPTGKESDPGELAGLDAGAIGRFLHATELREAFSGFGSAPANERLMAMGVGLIAGLEIASNALEPGEGEVAQVLKNAAMGKAGEAIVREQLVGEGKTILGSQVSARTSEGRRVIDHLVKDANGVHAVEVKTGNATRNGRQLAKDNAMATNGAKLVGKNAPTDMKGTEVWKVLR